MVRGWIFWEYEQAPISTGGKVKHMCGQVDRYDDGTTMGIQGSPLPLLLYL